MNTELPVSIQKLLWDADMRSFDTKKHQQLVIERTLNYGTLADWRWLIAHYGANSVREELKMRSTPSRSAIRASSRQLATMII